MAFAVLRLNSAVTKCCEDNHLFLLEIMLNLDSFLLTICIHVLHYIHTMQLYLKFINSYLNFNEFSKILWNH